MNKEELYKLALSDVPKYSLLNEIYAIRDTRYENVDYTIYANGCISLDVLNRYVNLINQVEKLTQENNDLENLYILARDNLSKSLLENADLKELVNGIREERDYLFNKLTFEKQQLQSVIDKAINQIEITIETIKQQPSKNIKDDEYLIVRLKSFINILGSKE